MASDLIFQRGRRDDVLVLCDHAGNRIPDELDRLGLDARDLDRHIGWDPGALAVAQRLAASIDCDLLGWSISRLVADPNRAEDHSDLILARSDDVFVPGNEHLDDSGREARIANWHRPYHAAIEAAVNRRLAAGISPLVVAVHSFEPVWAGLPRPWSIGVLWKQSPEPVRGVIAALNDDGSVVGENQPYDGRVAMGYTLDAHALQRGLPHVMFEIRNDLIRTDAGAAHWAARIEHGLRAGGLLGDA